jgi:hypothetical protein
MINNAKPLPHMTNKMAHPTGTAMQNRKALRKPKLAANAVDKVVLGPGVKLTATHIASKVAHSVVFIQACKR